MYPTLDPNLNGIMIDDLNRGRRPLTAADLRPSVASGFLVKVACFGDSLGHNAIYSTGAGATAAAGNWFVEGATENYWRDWGWPAWIGPLSMQRAQVVKSWCRQTNGVLAAGSAPAGYPLSAQVTAALADPLWPDVNLAIIMIGTNDTAFSLASWTSELLAQIYRIRKPVVLVAAPPRNDSVSTTDGGDGLKGWAWLLQARAICRRIADASAGAVKFVDGYGLCNTPGTTPDVMAASYVQSDNIHFTNVGACRVVDQGIIPAIFPSGLAGDLDMWPHNSSAATSIGTSPSYTVDQGHANPLMISTGGTVPAGTAYGSQTIVAVGSPSSVTGATGTANPYGLGNLQQITTVAAAAGDGFSATGASFHNAGGTFLSAGDSAWVQSLIVLKSGGIYPRGIELRLVGFNGTNYFSIWGNPDATKQGALPFTGDKTLLVRTPTFVMPNMTAFSSLTARLIVYYAGAGTGVVQYNLECRRFRSGGVYK